MTLGCCCNSTPCLVFWMPKMLPRVLRLQWRKREDESHLKTTFAKKTEEIIDNSCMISPCCKHQWYSTMLFPKVISLMSFSCSEGKLACCTKCWLSYFEELAFCLTKEYFKLPCTCARSHVPKYVFFLCNGSLILNKQVLRVASCKRLLKCLEILKCWCSLLWLK